MIERLLIPIVAMAALGLTFGLGLAYALKIFGIKIDPVISQILSKLPGANCGACGKAGCAGFAEALKNKEAIPAACAVINDEARKSIAQLLGVEYNEAVKTTATVLCNGGSRAKNKYEYQGLKTCKSSSLLFGGYKTCAFGCLGFGDCVKACPFDAIRINKDGLPEVDADKCTSCGNCVKACPKKLIELTPITGYYYVRCSSKDAGAAVRKACSAGCIACRKCEKVCPSSAIKVDSNLSKIDYSKCTNAGKCAESCPTKVIIRR